jgi:hypothetical protein
VGINSSLRKLHIIASLEARGKDCCELDYRSLHFQHL